MHVRVVGWSLVVLFLGVVAGCQPENPLGRKAVTGTATLNGEPIKNGSVALMPLSDPTTVAGSMIKDGKFNIDTERGLKPGDYAVTISIPDPDWTPEKAFRPKNVAPVDWQTGKGHTITVTENGPNQFEFALVNDKPVVYGAAENQGMGAPPVKK